MKTKWSIHRGVRTLGLTLTWCGNSEKKKAEEQLVMAQEAFHATLRAVKTKNEIQGLHFTILMC